MQQRNGPTDTSTSTKRHRPQLDATEVNYQQVLDLLTRLSHRSDKELGPAAGLTRQTFANRRQGYARIRPGDLPALAEVFDVPVALFAKSVNDALLWMIGNDHLLTRGRTFAQPPPGARRAG